MASLDSEAKKLIEQTEAQTRAAKDWTSKIWKIKATLYATEKKGPLDLDKIPMLAPQGAVVRGGWNKADRKAAKKQDKLISQLRNAHNQALSSVEMALIQHTAALRKAKYQITYTWKDDPTSFSPARLKHVKSEHARLVSKLGGELASLVAKVDKTQGPTHQAMGAQIKLLESKGEAGEAKVKPYISGFRAYMKADKGFRLPRIY